MMSLEPWTIAGVAIRICWPRVKCATATRSTTAASARSVHGDRGRLRTSARRQRSVPGYAGWRASLRSGRRRFHRASASGNPIAPITHHWLTPRTSSLVSSPQACRDSDGRSRGRRSMAASPTSRAPILILPRSTRARARFVAPPDRWALQVSAGHLREAEAGLAARRRTTSIEDGVGDLPSAARREGFLGVNRCVWREPGAERDRRDARSDHSCVAP